MKTLKCVLFVGAVVGLRLFVVGSEPAQSDCKKEGIEITEWTRRAVFVGVLSEIPSAGKKVKALLDTNTVVRFSMDESTNANMEFYRELKVCESVENVTLTNIEANQIDLTSVLSLFPNATEIRVYLGGKIDASFPNLVSCEDLRMDSVISPRTLKSLVKMERLKRVSFHVDQRTQFEDLENLARMKRLETAYVYPGAEFYIPKEWVERLKTSPKLRNLIDPIRCGWTEIGPP